MSEVSEARPENIAKLPTGRNTLLLSASMAALYGMVQLSAALSTVTFVAVTGVSGLAGLGPAATALRSPPRLCQRSCVAGERSRLYWPP